MAMPRKLKLMNVFLNGYSYQGVAKSVTLPKLTRKLENYRGAGMNGSAPVDLGLDDDALSMEWSLGGLPQNRKPSRRISVVTPDSLSRSASVPDSCKSQNTDALMPVTPFTPTLDSVLCQPCSWSILARRPSARAVAYAVAVVLVTVSHARKSGQMTISSRWLKFWR